MLSRHFLRSKVLQTVYAVHADPVELAVAEKNYKHNIYRLNDLGTKQVSALVHFAEVAGVMIDEAQHKYLPTEAERNPNRRLPNNVFLNKLAENYDFRHHCKESNATWGGVEYDEMFRQAYVAFTKLPDYAEYLASKESFAEDHQFALKLFKFLMNHEPLRDNLFSQSLLWEDDFDQIAQYNFMMLKALNENLNESTFIPVMHDDRVEKDVEAFEFSRLLLLNTLRHTEEVEAMIRGHLKGWEYERVASMDVLLLNMAVAELTEFPSTPERATVARSAMNLLEVPTGRINKSGRGLYDPSFNPQEED